MTIVTPPAGDASSPADEIFRLLEGYQITQILYVGVRLGIPDALCNGAKLCSELAEITGANADALRRLLRGLVCLNVIEEDNADRFRLSPAGEYLRSDHPETLRFAVLLLASPEFRMTWSLLEDCIRTGTHANQILSGQEDAFDHYGRSEDFRKLYDAGLAGLSSAFGPAVVRAYDFDRFGVVVDVGGGHGQLLFRILKQHPHLSGILFDRPEVVAAVQSSINRELVSRCRLIGGDMLTEVPPGGSLYILSRVLHDWGDDKAITILKACRKAMSSTSRLLIVERIIPTTYLEEIDRRLCILSDLMMLVRTGGRERTAEEYEKLCRAADLVPQRLIPASSGYSLIEATSVNST
jgi:hypothetical protein